MSALYKAYVDPGGLFDLVDPSALVPNLDRARLDRQGREHAAGRPRTTRSR